MIAPTRNPLRFPGTLGVALASWLAAMAMLSCGAIGVDVGGATGQCSVDNDCGLSGLTCFEHRVCIVKQAPATSVSVRLLPPVASGKLTEDFQLDLQAGSQAEIVSLMLAEPAVVHGQVRSADTDFKPVPGELVATAPTEATGTTLQFQATVYNAPKYCAGLPVCQDFELRVQAGHTYDLAFYPQESTTFPPHYSSLTAGGSIDNWKIVLPKESDLVRVTGRLMAGQQPLVGMRVFLQDAAGRPTSTRDVTTSTPRKVGVQGDVLPPGAFRLLVDPTAQKGRLRFEPIEPGMAMPQGLVGDVIDIGAAGLKQSGVELGPLNLGPLPPPAAVTLTVLGPTGKPEDGALVRLQWPLPGGALDDLDATVEVAGKTDAQGQFTAMMPAVKLAALVQPGAESQAGRWTNKVDAKASPLVVQCPARVVLSGQVLDYVGHQVAKATIYLRKVGFQQGEQAILGATTQSDPSVLAKTDGDGRFSTPIDPGDWWLWAVPPEGALLPRFLAARVTVQPGVKPAAILVNIPAPLLLRGRVVTASGAVVAKVGVDINGLASLTPALLGTSSRAGAPDADDPPGTTVVAQSHLLASTVTNALGLFEVLVAPPQ